MAGKRYELLEKLGQGAMGLVHRAHDRRLDRCVALKQLSGLPPKSPEGQRLRREAQIGAGLQHPGIVAVHDVGEDEGELYLTMELVEGPGWQNHVSSLDRRGRIDLLARVAEAVGYAHQRGVVHRDIKPGNILLDSAGLPHLADFGLARRVGGRHEVERLTLSGEMLGTVGYMSPEQIEGRNDVVGPPSDVWALGSMLYELLTGSLPFERATLTDSLLAVLRGDPVPPRRIDRSIPIELETIALKCLERLPSARYADGAALARDLQAYLDGRGIEARPVGRLKRMVRGVVRRRGLRVALATIVLGLAAAGLGREAWRRRQHRAALVAARSAWRQGRAQPDQLVVARDHAREALYFCDTEDTRRLLASIGARLSQIEHSRRERAELADRSRIVAEILIGPFADGVKAVELAARMDYGEVRDAQRLAGLRRRLIQAADATALSYPASPVVAAYRAYFDWLAGDRDGGRKRLARVAKAAPGFPFAHLFLVLTSVSQYLKLFQPPVERLMRDGVRVTGRRRSPQMRLVGAKIRLLLERAGQARVFPNRAARDAFQRFTNAVELLTGGDTDGAARLLSGAVWEPLLRPYAMQMLGDAYFFMDRYDEAIRIYHEVIRETGCARLRYHVALCLRFQIRGEWPAKRKRQQLQQCVAELDASLAEEPLHAGTRVFKANCLVMLAVVVPPRESGDVIAQARAVLAAIDSKQQAALYVLESRANLERIAWECGQPGAPISLLRRADKLYSQAWQARGKKYSSFIVQWANVLYFLGRDAVGKEYETLFARAVALLERACREEPGWAGPHLTLANFYCWRAERVARTPARALELVGRAQREFGLAARLDRKEVDAHLGLAWCERVRADREPARAIEHLQTAVGHVERALALQRTPRTLAEQAKLLMSIGFEQPRGDWLRRAESLIKEALAASPEPEVRLTRAFLYQGWIAEDASLTPARVDQWMGLVVPDLLDLVRTHPGFARRAIRSLVSACAHLIWAREKLGRGIEEAYRHDLAALELAIRHGVEPIKYTVELADRWGTLAAHRQRKGRDVGQVCKQAAEAFVRAAQAVAKSDDVGWRRHIARCWTLAGNMLILRARAIKPRVGDVSGVYRQALSYLDQAIKRQPGFHFAYYYRAICALELERLDVAMADIEHLESVRALPEPLQRQVAQVRAQIAQLLRGRK